MFAQQTQPIVARSAPGGTGSRSSGRGRSRLGEPAAMLRLRDDDRRGPPARARVGVHEVGRRAVRRSPVDSACGPHGAPAGSSRYAAAAARPRWPRRRPRAGPASGRRPRPIARTAAASPGRCPRYQAPPATASPDGIRQAAGDAGAPSPGRWHRRRAPRSRRPDQPAGRPRDGGRRAHQRQRVADAHEVARAVVHDRERRPAVIPERPLVDGTPPAAGRRRRRRGARGPAT